MSKGYERNEKQQSYVVGSNAVVLDNHHDDFEYTHYKKVEKKEIKETYSINPASTLLLVMVILATIFICVIMLKAQFEVADTSEQINALKNELSVLKNSNGQLLSQINESLDLNEIRDIAMNEYGMVYPEGKDVVEIMPRAESYTIQYEIVEPVKKDKFTIKNMMAFITRGW